MSGIPVLFGLLVLAYVGSILVSGRTIRGFGLPSGAEYVLLGVVLGPSALGVVELSAVRSFEVILIVGVSWIALLTGLSYRHVGRRKAHPGRLLFGAVTAAGIGVAVAGATYFVLGELSILFAAERRLASFGAGAVVAETTRHMIRWVAERHGARGKLSDWFADMARGSAIVPILAVALMSAALPHGGQPLPFLAKLGITFGVGAVLGLVAAVILGREFRQHESWGILIGVSLLGTGVALRLGLSPLGTCFALGLSLSLFSRHQDDIRALVKPSEQPVLLPVLLMAGIYFDFSVLRAFLPFLIAALVASFLAELVRGALLNVLLPEARAVGPLISVGMISTGPITIIVALALMLRAPGNVTSAVLNLAVVGVVFGEFVGPAMLRRALARAGETHAVSDDDQRPSLASHPAPGAEPTEEKP